VTDPGLSALVNAAQITNTCDMGQKVYGLDKSLTELYPHRADGWDERQSNGRKRVLSKIAKTSIKAHTRPDRRRTDPIGLHWGETGAVSRGVWKIPQGKKPASSGPMKAKFTHHSFSSWARAPFTGSCSQGHLEGKKMKTGITHRYLAARVRAACTRTDGKKAGIEEPTKN